MGKFAKVKKKFSLGNQKENSFEFTEKAARSSSVQFKFIFWEMLWNGYITIVRVAIEPTTTAERA